MQCVNTGTGTGTEVRTGTGAGTELATDEAWTWREACERTEVAESQSERRKSALKTPVLI